MSQLDCVTHIIRDRDDSSIVLGGGRKVESVFHEGANLTAKDFTKDQGYHGALQVMRQLVQTMGASKNTWKKRILMHTERSAPAIAHRLKPAHDIELIQLAIKT